MGDKHNIIEIGQDMSLWYNEASRKISIQGTITGESFLKLTSVIDDFAHDSEKDTILYDKPLSLFIDSAGGTMTHGMLLHDMLKEFPNLTTYAQGFVGSVAICLFLAGKERVVYPHSHLMIHKSNWSSGDRNFSAAQLGSQQAFNSTLDNELLSIISKVSKIKPGTVIKQLNKHTDWYISSKEAIALGLATKMIGNEGKTK